MIYGSSAWDIITDEKTKQDNLIINANNEYSITVDNIELAQFIYLLLNNKKLRDIIDVITAKAVFNTWTFFWR